MPPPNHPFHTLHLPHLFAHANTTSLFAKHNLDTSVAALEGITRDDLLQLGISWGDANTIVHAVRRHFQRNPSVRKRVVRRSSTRNDRAPRKRSHSNPSTMREMMAFACLCVAQRNTAGGVDCVQTSEHNNDDDDDAAEPPSLSRQHHRHHHPTLTRCNTSPTLSQSDTYAKPRVFLTHAWGDDQQRRNNHARVRQLVRALQCTAQVVPWFDDDQMHGDVTQAMCTGLDTSDAVLVCITRAYINKCAREGNDNCKLELNYAYARKGVQRLVPVVMERDCLDTRTWNGAVGAYLDTHLYIPCTTDGELYANVGKIVDAVKRACWHRDTHHTEPARERAVSASHVVEHWRACARVSAAV